MKEVVNTRVLWAIPLLITIFSLSFPAYAKYSEGTGEPNDPYQIATAEDLILLGETPNDYDKYFVLTGDIDLDPNLPGRKVFDKAVIASASALDVSPWVEGTAFTGVFDGNGHTISHLTIVGKDYLGLFGQLEFGAEVKNLGVVDVNVTGSGNFAGGLVGLNWDGSIATSYSTGAVSGNEDVGGLVGYNWFGSITTSYSTGSVGGTGGNNVGGLVGFNRRGSITSSYSTGMVTGDEDVGGLVGSNYGDASITTSYSTGTVTGNSSVGGLVGLNWFGSISTSYSTGSVSGNSDVGGLVGYSDYGIIIITSFWDIENSGQATSAGGTGLTTAEMQDPNVFMDAGWDFVGKPDGPHDIWAESEGGGYPILCWQLPQGFGLPTFSGGTGEADDPYRISTPRELNGIGHNPRLMDAYFELVNDIDLAGIDFYIIGSEFYPFTGSFNGNGHTISHMTIVGKNYVGLFGLLESGAEVKNLGVVDVNVTGAYYCGSLVGFNSGGSITTSYSTGVVSGDIAVGGLVGVNSGSITTSYSAGTVSGNSGVGGLVGDNDGSITSSYSTGMVTGDDYVGGLVGFNFIGSSITTCYSTGEVSATSWEVGGLVGDSMSRAEVHNSFWDIETSGQTSSAGGTGKTTAEMQMESTYIGWGCEPVWTIDDGKDYPRLWWENKPGDALPVLSEFLAGAGTEDAPYLIYTAEQLNVISVFPCDWDKHFKLMADIDLIAYTGTDFNIIGIDWHNPFSGVFDGSGHTISNFSYTSTDTGYVGLFTYVSGENALIKNLGLIDPNVNAGSGDNIGSLVGWLGEGTITNCYVQGGSVTGDWRVGGLVGDNSYGGTITNCYATGSVSGGWAVGGLVGYNRGTITNCYATASVTGRWFVGGLVGSGGTITNCYSSASVSGNRYVGGLVGENWATITNCYSTGRVSGNSDVGGLVGAGYGRVTDSFWDIEASGQTISAGGVGKTTAEMQTESTFTDAGWDFLAESVNGTEDIWWILEGQDYPRLWWELIPESRFVSILSASQVYFSGSFQKNSCCIYKTLSPVCSLMCVSYFAGVP